MLRIKYVFFIKEKATCSSLIHYKNVYKLPIIVKTKIDKCFNKDLIDKIGIETSFALRKAKKITAYNFF